MFKLLKSLPALKHPMAPTSRFYRALTLPCHVDGVPLGRSQREEDTYFEIQVLYSKKYTRPIQGSGKEAELATSLGADYVGGQELIAKVQASEIKFDQVLCTPGMYPHVVKIARTLGPLGLMPTPKKGTVTSDIAAGIDKLRGLHKFRSDIHGCIHTQNIVALLYAIFEIGAPTVKKGFLEKIVLKTQLGPPIVLEDAFGLVLDQWNLSKLSGPQTA
ncbi:hypothetical protein L0F63_005227 [Massospora cicadina]|nr:hypothetical protein L0F63_005227 [Massospora cicadina]